MSHVHKRNAFDLLSQLPPVREMSSSPVFEIAGTATPHALLAIEMRLEELVRQEELANLIAAYRSGVLQEVDTGLHRTVVRRIVSIIQQRSTRLSGEMP